MTAHLGSRDGTSRRIPRPIKTKGARGAKATDEAAPEYDSASLQDVLKLREREANLQREQDKYRQAVAAVIEYFRHRLRGTTHWHGCESAHPECAMLESLCRLQVAPETEGKHDHG